MSMLDWAKREVEIACKKENPDRKEGEFDYGCACYMSALRAFESLCKDGHSGFSIKMTQNILNRLIDGQPLTPIEDTDDVWNEVEMCDRYRTFQCCRMSSLFKDVYPDGSVKYDDLDCYYCVDINNPNNTYKGGIARKIVDELFPITMPYMPGKPIKVFCEDFLTDHKNGDLDTIGVRYALKEKDGEYEIIEIDRFFRTPEEGDTQIYHGLVEISKEEYEERKRSCLK